MLVAIKRSSSSSTSIRGGRNARNQIKTESRNEVVVSRMEYKVEESGRREKIPTLEAFGDEIVTIDVDPCRYSLSSSIWRPIFSSTMHLLHPYPSWGCCISGAMLGVSRSTGAERERLCTLQPCIETEESSVCFQDFLSSLLFTAKFTATFLSGFMEMMNIPAGRSHGSQSDSIMCYMLSARRAYYRPLAVAESLRQNQDVSWRRAI